MLWTIRVVPRDHEGLDGALGMTHEGTCQILLAAGQSREALLDTYLHELTHAWAIASGTRHTIELATGLPEEKAAKFEEMLVRLIAGTFRPVLESAGWTPPKAFP